MSQNQLFTGARFATKSTCGRYRFSLLRLWDESKPLCAFIGLNPSFADDTKDDPTIRRVIRFAQRWGFGGVYMFNIFPVITPYPERLTFNEVAENDKHILNDAKECALIVFAWGNFKKAVERGKVMSALFPNAVCLEKNKNGSPKHPLYVNGSVQPITYN